MKKIISLVALFVIINVFTTSVMAMSTPELKVNFDPQTWAEPGSMVNVVATVTNTDTQNDLTDADINLTIFTQSQYNPTLVSTDMNYSCVRTDSGRYSTPQYLCSGGIIPPGGTATIKFVIQTPDVANIKYGATATINNYNLTANDSIVIVPFYMPDLTVNVTTKNNTVLQGSETPITVSVYNGGYLESVATNLVVNYPDGSSENLVVPSLNPQSFYTYNLTFAPQVTGLQTINVVVDPDNTVLEYSETNNQDYLNLNVNPALPDLTMNISSPTTVIKRLPFVENVTVTNQGSLVANNITTNILFSGPYNFANVSSFVSDHGFVCSKTIFKRWTTIRLTGYVCSGGKLNPGETANISATVVAPYYPGLYYTNGKVDTNNTIIESNENNNNKQWSITVL